MTLNEYAQECHKIAKEHGWWEKDRTPLEIAALIMTELAEFVEGARVGNVDNMVEEIADVFIRSFDYIGKEYPNLDFDKIVQDKMEKNRNRPYRHGNKLY